ncbi:hypothetical protein X949_4035 [Burkholderia pseudomallei MSHR5609]|nr:hypothetical protein BURPS668_1516 [Burkholderia pseudomallei 668]ACQ98605.1 conserved hypothetical protein [Burkholderia pseudomallei MSHR346]KGS42918.1 hypothetical protein X992_4335 [Burkholderia pseudomallei MSHR5492]KGS56920.1 hypothetical protein X949_4035 [Burkholderia pseudomallei MSHR5609]
MRDSLAVFEVACKRAPDDLRHVYVVIYRTLPHSSPHIGMDLE